MKFFITSAVIALLIAVVLAVRWPDATAQKNAAISSEHNRRAFSTKTVAPSGSALTEKETVNVEPGGEVDREAETLESHSQPPLLDALPLYDILLTLNFSADGNLVLDRYARATLQVMFNQVGLPGDEERMDALRALLAEALPEETAQQLLELLQNYSEYRQAEQDLRNTLSAARDNDSPLANYDQIKALRRSYLGDQVASGLFSEEEAQLPYMVEAMAVARDASLSEEERAQKLAALQAGFNEAASRMDSPLAEKVLAARVARLRAEGASDAEIFAVRNDVLGSAEAQRLAELDLANRNDEPEP